ncbi:ankyrin repeat-containing domain protein [Aspergillus falconensis]
MKMANFRLFDLPKELVLEVLEACERHDLATFIRTSNASWNIGHPVLYALPIEEKQRVFLWAARTNRDGLVKYILDDILASIRDSAAFRDSAFLTAARSGCTSILKLPLGNGADPSSALVEATTADKPEVVKILLEYGAKLEEFPPHDFYMRPVDVGKENILHYAAMQGSTEMVRFLLTSNFGLNIDKADQNSDTALMKASFKGYHSTVAILLAHKAKPNLANAQGHTPLSRAAGHGHTDVMQMLLDAGAKVGGTERHNPLLHAAGSMHHEAASLLLDRGADVNWVGPTLGQTALHNAVIRGDHRMVRLLLDHGADVDQKNCLSMTPLCEATPCIETSRMLLDAGASVTVDGNLPLIIATISDDRHVVELLLTRRPSLTDIERTDLLGRTALAAAAAHNRPQILQMLMKAGCDINKPDRTGQTPLSRAIENGSDECAAILRRAGACEADLDGTVPEGILDLFASLVHGLRRP